MSRPISKRSLASALPKLGFKRYMNGSLIVYRLEEKDATIVVPSNPSSSRILSFYLTAARETVLGKGIADAATWEKLMSPPRLAGAQVIAKSSRNGATRAKKTSKTSPAGRGRSSVVPPSEREPSL